MQVARIGDTVIARSDSTEVVEGNHYFPPEALEREYFVQSDHRTTCPWKGEARYYDVQIDGESHENVAWYYPEPKPAASQIRDHVAFWKAATVTEES